MSDEKSFDDFANVYTFPPDKADDPPPEPEPLATITPAAWKGTPIPEDVWLAFNRIPGDDLTVLTGDGGMGKTEIAIQLCIIVSAGLGDWLGSVVEIVESGSTGTMFYSAEERETKVRKRVNRICKSRGLDPDSIDNLHQYFPDLDDCYLVTVGHGGRLQPTKNWFRLVATIKQIKPRLVVIDNVAAVFDGEAISRRQVRRFCNLLRKVAHSNNCAIILLDHPSVRGMTDGSGTSNSVDWRNGPRAMLYLYRPDKDDCDERTLEVTKNNDGISGEKVKLRWNGLTFTTAATTASLHKAKAEREVDELFLRLLDKRNAQGRRVHANTAKGSAPSEFAIDPEANGVTTDAFRRSMERLFNAGKIRPVETGPASKRRQHIETVQ